MTQAVRRSAKRLAAPIAALLVAGCIPQVSPPPGPPPPARPAPVYEEPASLPPPPPSERPSRAEPVERLPAPRPAWEARPVTPDAAEVETQVYLVQPGDTLRSIGNRTGAGSEAIARANDLIAPFAIRPGQRLTIPGGRYHLVREGQTGIAIARAYSIAWTQIIAANGLAEPYILRVGQRVLIPGAADRPASAAQRAAAFSLDIDDILTGGEPAIAANKAPATPVASSKRVLPVTAAVAAPLSNPGRFAWPLDGNVVKRFGRGGTGERNDGIKIAVALDTPVKAVADGTVAYVGDSIAALGGLVIVKHGGGWTSIYGHAAKLMVRRGQAVKRGQTIALSGDSGYADRPELHFELRQGRTPVDPLTQLPRR